MDYKKIFLKEAKPTSIGGQAVMEGIMMRGSDRTALAMRLPTGEIFLKTEKQLPPSGWTKIPFVRGVVAFVHSLVLGMRTLMDSADVLEQAMPEEEEEEPGRFERWMNERFGARAMWNLMLLCSLLVAVVITVLAFVIFPTVAVNWMGRWVKNAIALNLIEGAFRILLFVLYIAGISRMQDIRRLFMYHGAEHMTIHCYENEQELTPEHAAEFYRLHPRCGTSFLMFVLIISLLLFSFLGWPNLLLRIASRILLLPVIAGVSYELLRWAGRSDNAVIRVLSYPGLLLQKLTTREPDADQLEIAIVALKAVLKPAEVRDIEGLVDTDANLIEARQMTSGRHYDGKRYQGETLVPVPQETAETADEEPSIFRDLEGKRYGEDVSMARNTVRRGREILRAAGIENGKNEADDIFCYVTGFSHTEILTRGDELLNDEDIREYEARIARRASGTPLQYITRVQDFMGLPFRVNESVLIPRLDTEVLAEQAIGLLRGRGYAEPDVLDLCTGSGALGVSIAHLIPTAKVTLADLSAEALTVAIRNARLHGVTERCRFVQGNLFGGIGEEEQFDLIVSNPPYIRSDEIETLAPEVRDHEPRMALDGGEDGLDAYRVIALEARRHLKEKGVLALEIGWDQAAAVSLLLERTKYYKAPVVVQDLQGRDRVILIERA